VVVKKVSIFWTFFDLKTCISFLKKIIKLETWKEYFEKNLPDILGICKLWYECNLLSIRRKKKFSNFWNNKKQKILFSVYLNQKTKQISGIYDCRMEVLFLLYSIFPTIFVQFFTTPYVPYIFSLKKIKIPP